MKYILAVQTPAVPLDSGGFAVESAFAIHLNELQTLLCSQGFSEFLLIAPVLKSVEVVPPGYTHIAPRNDVLFSFIRTHTDNCSPTRFWIVEFPPMLKRLSAVVFEDTVVHSGMSFDIRRPMLLILNALAFFRRSLVVFIVDIDFRDDPARYLSLRIRSLTKYAINRLVLQPFRHAQISFACTNFDLVLLKSAAMVTDYGKGRESVKNFFDTVHSCEQILTTSQLRFKLREIRAGGKLRVCFFGRLVAKKGVDRIIEAVAQARSTGCPVRLFVIGNGPEKDPLSLLAEKLGVSGFVHVHNGVSYGQALFEFLDQMHLAINAPLVEDTRAAFDAMAR